MPTPHTHGPLPRTITLHWRVVVLAVGCVLAQANMAHAQTGRLNDTGQTTCYDASNTAATCNAATVGNVGSRPHQDSRYGRDAAGSGLTKTGGGVAGFDYSCVLWNGTVVNGPNCTAGLVANTTGIASGTTATDWACTKDNVTGLVWSLQTQNTTWDTAAGASYPNAGHNALSRCGYSTGWRLPTRRELLSIVHNGLAASPVVDASYLPATQNDGYWTSDAYAPNTTEAWIVHFSNGNTGSAGKSFNNFSVRLVRSGP